MTKESSFQFEQAFSRLEEILSSINEGKVGLDQTLQLYEEANQLILSCTKRLNEAENRVEILIKQRSGEPLTDANGNPATQPFTPDNRG